MTKTREPLTNETEPDLRPSTAGPRGRVVPAVAGLTLAVALFASAHAWRYRNSFLEARTEVNSGRYAEAAARLEGLSASRPLWSPAEPGEVDSLLGLSLWRLGRRDDALQAFSRVPEGSPFAAQAALYLAEGDLDRGRWRAAGERLEHALESGAPRQDVLAGLERIYRMQCRVEDAARVVRWRCRDTGSSAEVLASRLRDLWRTERGTPPLETIAKALEIGAKLDPDDERVWLGRARVATRMGRLDEAETWLARCESKRPDQAVWRARLDWARAADRPDVAARVLRIMGAAAGQRSGGDRGKEPQEGPVPPRVLTDAERLAWRAWFDQRSGDTQAERRALRDLLAVAPRDPRWLARLAAIEAQVGSAASAQELRATKAEVDRALDAYTQLMAEPNPGDVAPRCLENARLALDAGRTFDATVWTGMAGRLGQASPEARAQSERLAAQVSAEPPEPTSLRSDPDPWLASLPATPVDRRAEAPGTVPPAFTDDARAAGLGHVFRNGETLIRQMPVALGGGVGLLDYDGDGLLDVYCVQGGPFPPESRPSEADGDRLFRNRGDGTFEDVTERSGIAATPKGYGFGVSVGDVDNDGRPDLFVTRWRRYALYRNNGDGSFEDVTERYGLAGDRDWPTSAAFADLDGDGDLDLYVCHYATWDETNPRLCRNAGTNAFMSCNPKTCPARPDHVFRNDGGRFVDVSKQSGVTAADTDGRGLGVVAADLDVDGRVDLFVANDKSANFLFRNLGGFKFEEVAHASGLAGNTEGGYQAGMGAACGDLDGDGRPDLVVTNYYGESSTYYHNDGGGLFTDRTAASGLGAASRLLLGFGVAALDTNNDGLLDLLTANGHTDDLGDTPYRMPAQLLVGLGRGRFGDASAAAGRALSTPRLGRGLAAGDLDNDGRVDALLVAHNEPLTVLHNRTPQTGHWVTFRLEGTTSNRDGVGAVVTVEAGGTRQVSARVGGSSYLSAGDPRVHFGLGPARRVGAVEVRWPSRRVDRYRDLPADAIYHVREGDPAPRPVAAGRSPRGLEAVSASSRRTGHVRAERGLP